MPHNFDIQKISEAISATMDIDELLNLITINCQSVLEAQGCVLRLKNDEGSLGITASYFTDNSFYTDEVRAFGKKIADQRRNCPRYFLTTCDEQQDIGESYQDDEQTEQSSE